MMATLSPSAAQATTTGRLRVLIVEDERDLVDLLTYNLQREGYDTIREEVAGGVA